MKLHAWARSRGLGGLDTRQLRRARRREGRSKVARCSGCGISLALALQVPSACRCESRYSGLTSNPPSHAPEQPGS